jgi:hypothetical protein
MYADEIYRSRRHSRALAGVRSHNAPREISDQDVVLKLIMASMPLAGLIFGVVALALWNAS